MRGQIQAIRVFVEAARVLVEAVRVLVEALRVLVEAMTVNIEAIPWLKVVLFSYLKCSVKLHFSQNSVPVCSEYSEWALPRHSEFCRRTTFSAE